MPHIEVIWTEGPDGNIAHLAEHDVFPEEAEEVLRNPTHTASSRRSGRPIAFGITRTGRHLAVVYEVIDRTTVLPVTAYDVD
jgi:hypothetical protein